jgi:hypothetical protein
MMRSRSSTETRFQEVGAVPYVWLALTGLGLFVATSRIGRFPTKVGLLFVAGSMIGLTDLFAILFRLYEFHPGLLAERVPDARLGMLLADGIFVPMLASTIVGSVSRWRYLVGLALVVVPFLFLENQFLIGRLYLHVHWKLWHSAALFSVYVAVLAAWAGYFERNGYNVLNRAILTLTSIHYLWLCYSILSSGVLNLFTLRPHLLADPVLDNVLSGFLLRFVPSGGIGLLWIWNRWVDKPAGIAALAATFAGWLLLLHLFGIPRAREPWHNAYGVLALTLIVLAAGRLDRWFAATSDRPALRT